MLVGQGGCSTSAQQGSTRAGMHSSDQPRAAQSVLVGQQASQQPASSQGFSVVLVSSSSSRAVRVSTLALVAMWNSSEGEDNNNNEGSPPELSEAIV